MEWNTGCSAYLLFKAAASLYPSPTALRTALLDMPTVGIVLAELPVLNPPVVTETIRPKGGSLDRATYRV
jgi:hypothetical protein